MNRIVHIALKVDDLDRTSEFYEKVFGFEPVETSKVRDHTSRHLSDGAIDLALIKYDSEESAEARAAGACRARADTRPASSPGQRRSAPARRPRSRA